MQRHLIFRRPNGVEEQTGSIARDGQSSGDFRLSRVLNLERVVAWRQTRGKLRVDLLWGYKHERQYGAVDGDRGAGDGLGQRIHRTKLYHGCQALTEDGNDRSWRNGGAGRLSYRIGNAGRSDIGNRDHRRYDAFRR